MAQIKIVLVDDYKFIRDALKIFLMNLPDIKIIGEAANANELFILLKTIKPDIILMDISLPKMSGIEITKKISLEQPEIKVIMSTANEKNEMILDSFKAGALGYLPKDVEQEELILAIETVFKGKEYIAKSLSNLIYIKT
jgi:DNA-binding NarL/FixJ family response regulator